MTPEWPPAAVTGAGSDPTGAVAILAPRGRDAVVAAQLLHKEGIGTIIVSGLDRLAALIEQRVGAVLITEEALAGPDEERLLRVLQDQPAWSDVPFVVLANGTVSNRSDRAIRRMDSLRNAVLLSRPLHAEELVRSVRSALTARGRQHDARKRMEELRLREKQLFESEAQFHAIADSVDQMIWSTTPTGFHDYFNRRWYEFTGVPYGSTDGEAWAELFHPDDQDNIWRRWRHSLGTGDHYEIEYRLKHRSGDYRWVLGRAQPVRNVDGRIIRWYGSCTDIHRMKTAEEQRQLMLAEMNHRVKNSLAMVHAIVSQTLRQAENLEDARAAIQSRIGMLSQAHDRLVQSSWTEAHILDVIDAALAPHRNGEARFIVKGPNLPVGSKQALALTMALHELATNAVKYGALSVAGGHVHLKWEMADAQFHLSWIETGGPPVAPPARKGFGSRMIEQALAGYFDGSAELDYDVGGLRFNLIAPVTGLTTGE
ncbi:sensor histidine kinase [Falsirhodobacter sp. alg1]|uniref:sensor histidine kinase n=1 Tax=Falsirhodobacter sp. alg1 TaxID=1472418 RepID=UPI0005EFB317|nr:HWE histidine kinase domain-containing protein [Falsirhodobacter sp. alg1]